MGGPMPSFASGLTCCTAWASTCAAEWRSTERPSGESMVTPSTSSPGARAVSRSLSTPFTRTTTTSRRSANSSVPVVAVSTVRVPVSGTVATGGWTTSDTCCSLRAGGRRHGVLGERSSGGRDVPGRSKGRRRRRRPSIVPTRAGGTNRKPRCVGPPAGAGLLVVGVLGLLGERVDVLVDRVRGDALDRVGHLVDALVGEELLGLAHQVAKAALALRCLAHVCSLGSTARTRRARNRTAPPRTLPTAPPRRHGTAQGPRACRHVRGGRRPPR